MNDKPETRTNLSNEQRGSRPSAADEPNTRLKAPKARGGEMSGHIRVLLIVSTVLAAAALLGVWWYYFG